MSVVASFNTSSVNVGETNHDSVKNDNLKHTTINISETTYDLTLRNDLLQITVVDRLLCEEYTKYLYDKELCKNKIITNIEIVYDMIEDGLQNKNNAIKINFKKENSKYLIQINANFSYFSEQYEIILNKVEKYITPKQVIDRIDYKFGIIEEKFKNILNEDNNKLKQKIDDLHKTVDDGFLECSFTIDETDKDLHNEINRLDKKIELLDNKINEVNERFLDLPLWIVFSTYTQSSGHPVYIPMPIYSQRVSSLHLSKDKYLFVSDTDIMIDNLYCNTYVPTSRNIYGCFLNFHTIEDICSGFKYLKNLKILKLSDPCLVGLNFLSHNTSLEQLRIENATELTSIEGISKLSNLHTLEILTPHRIIDLGLLVNCPNLKKLRIWKGTNTGVFNNNIKFEIEMI